jgi:hypothetical protein
MSAPSWSPYCFLLSHKNNEEQIWRSFTPAAKPQGLSSGNGRPVTFVPGTDSAFNAMRCLNTGLCMRSFHEAFKDECTKRFMTLQG